MRRRALLGLGIGLGPAAALMSAATPEALPVKRARFVEVGEALVMELSLAAILPRRDKQAMGVVSSGFATRLVYDLALHQHGKSRPVVKIRRSVRIHWDPWSHSYVVVTTDPGARPVQRRYVSQEEAVRGAVSVRIKLCKTSLLVRGRRASYFVHIVAQRNPRAELLTSSSHPRGQERDLTMFSRWVNVFMGDPPKAESVIERRSNYFYLVEG